MYWILQTRTGRFILALCSFVLGVVCAFFLPIPVIWVGGSAVICLLLLCLRKTRLWRVGFVTLFLFLCGMMRFSLAENTIPLAYTQEPVSLVGMVADFPQTKGALRKMRFTVWEKDRDILLYQSVSASALRYGDVLRLRCTLQEPPVLPDFDYKTFLKHQHIDAICYYPQIQEVVHGKGDPIQAQLFALRSFLQKQIMYWLPGSMGDVSNSLLFGSSYLLDESIKTNIQLVGLSHIFAISGQNILFFAVIFHGIVFCLGLSKQWRCLIVCLLIWAFIALIGFPESAVRAGIMGSLVYLGIALGRPYHMFSSIVFSAFLFVLYDPYVLFAVGFQLSYLAVIGIYFFYERAETWLGKLHVPEFLGLRGNLAMSLAVTPMVWPISVFVFHQFSWVSFVANILVLPAIGYVMVLLLILCLFSWTPVIAGPIAWIISIFVTYMLTVSAYFATFSAFIWKKLSLSWIILVFWYIITLATGIRNKMYVRLAQKNR